MMSHPNLAFRYFGDAAAPALSSASPAAEVKSPEQLRREWLMLRRGKFTASQFHRLMASPEKLLLSKGAETYALECAIELATEWTPDDYVSPAMQWGLDHEDEAVAAFAAKTGLEVVAHGDAQSFLAFGRDVGGTPDGLIPSERSGLEVKCPGSKAHIEYLGITDAQMLKAISPEYYWQCQGLMLINNSTSWYFASYDPRFNNPSARLHIAKITRSMDDWDALLSRIRLAVSFRDGILERLASIP
jgi:hypothetical protein